MDAGRADATGGQASVGDVRPGGGDVLSEPVVQVAQLLVREGMDELYAF